MQGKAQLPNKKIFSEYFESPVKFVPLGKSNINALHESTVKRGNTS